MVTSLGLVRAVSEGFVSGGTLGLVWYRDHKCEGVVVLWCGAGVMGVVAFICCDSGS